MNRFKISFNNNASFRPVQYQHVTAANLAPIPRSVAPPKNTSLNAPMIDRVYKAKPGCSSCGKKVA
jgi:hypothetical protein